MEAKEGVRESKESQGREERKGGSVRKVEEETKKRREGVRESKNGQ